MKHRPNIAQCVHFQTPQKSILMGNRWDALFLQIKISFIPDDKSKK